MGHWLWCAINMGHWLQDKGGKQNDFMTLQICHKRTSVTEDQTSYIRLNNKRQLNDKFVPIMTQPKYIFLSSQFIYNLYNYIQ
jgi:hypothetical protein